MTTYFDDMDDRIHALSERHRAGDFVSEDLGALERELVRDVAVCAMVPGFPEALRPAVHRCVLRWSYFARDPGLPEIDFADDDVWIARLYRMSSDLHGVFHAVGHAGADGFGDSPLRGVAVLCDRASDERLAMFAADPSLSPGRAGTTDGESTA